MQKHYSIFAIALIITSICWAQDKFTISGEIKNEEGKAVAFAHVLLEGTAKVCSANENGRFELIQVPAGKHTVIVSSIGFHTLRKDITISEGKSNHILFNMQSNSTELSSVEVFGEREKQPEKLDILTRLPLQPSDQIQSISVISDQLIQKQGNLTISEAARNVPGVYTFATYGNVRESMSARGFRGIPVLKNGVRVNSDFRGTGVLTDMQGVESIQVLKGSAAVTQGVATDLGSPGGVVNIVTKTPRFYNGGKASLRIGSWGQVRPTIDIYGPVNESKTVAFRINAAYEHANSYRKSIVNEKIYINPSLEWRPDEKTSIILEMDYLDDSRTPDPGTINLGSNDEDAIYDLPYDKFLGFEENRASTVNATYAVRVNRELSEKISFRGAFFSSTLDVDQISTSLSSGGGRGSQVLPELDNYNKRYRTLGESNRLDNNSVVQLDIVGQELKTGTFKHTFQVGVDYRNTDLETGGASMGSLEYIDIIDVFGSIPNSLPQMAFLYLPDESKTEETDINLSPNAIVASNSKSFGIMAQDVVEITDWTKVFFGLRYSSNESSSSASPTVSRGHAIDPQLGLMLSPYKGINVFGSYTTSTSLRGADNLDINGNELGNQRIDQLEAGIKSDWLNKRLRFNLTFYKINNKNMSMPVYDNNWIETGFYAKGGNDERKGIEMEIVGRPFLNLELVAGYAYIDAQYKEHASFYTNSSPLNTPDHTANFWANYSIRSGKLAGFQFGAGSYYISSRPINDWAKTVTHEGIIPDQKPFEIDAYTIVNAQIAYNKNKYGVRLLFNNIFDQIGYNAYRTRFINQTDPRSFAVVLNYRF